MGARICSIRRRRLHHVRNTVAVEVTYRDSRWCVRNARRKRGLETLRSHAREREDVRGTGRGRCSRQKDGHKKDRQTRWMAQGSISSPNLRILRRHRALRYLRQRLRTPLNPQPKEQRPTDLSGGPSVDSSSASLLLLSKPVHKPVIESEAVLHLRPISRTKILSRQPQRQVRADVHLAEHAAIHGIGRGV